MHHRRAARMMKKPSVIDSPSGKAPERPLDGIAEERRLVGGGKMFWLALWGFPNIWAFIEVELGQTEPRGAHKASGCAYPMGAPYCLVVSLLLVWSPSKASRVSFILKKSSKSFVAFGLHLVLIAWKTKNKQKITTNTWPGLIGLVPKWYKIPQKVI